MENTPRRSTRAAKPEPAPSPDTIADSTSEVADSHIQPVLDTIGRNMRDERKRRGLSAATMAKTLDIAASYIRMLEAGRRIPSLPILLRICEFFDYTLDELISPEGKASRDAAMPKLADAKKSSLRAAQEEVLSLVSSLTAEELTFIADCMRGLIATLRGSKNPK